MLMTMAWCYAMHELLVINGESTTSQDLPAWSHNAASKRVMLKRGVATVSMLKSKPKFSCDGQSQKAKLADTELDIDKPLPARTTTVPAA